MVYVVHTLLYCMVHVVHTLLLLYLYQNTLHRDMLRIPLTNHASENPRSMCMKSMRLGQAKLIVSFSFSSVRTLTVCSFLCHLVGGVSTTIVGKNETRLRAHFDCRQFFMPLGGRGFNNNHWQK